MAITRIKFPDRGAIRSFADAMDADPELKRGAREVRRALERPGRMAELTEREAVAAAAVADQMVPRAAALARDAEKDALARGIRERARPNPGEIIRNRRRALGLYSE